MTASKGSYSNYTCSNRGLLLPIVNEFTWSLELRIFLYLIGMCYCFLGIAIIADIFMASIERITSVTKKIIISNVNRDEPEVIEVRIWNDTVANLTLMALGSSAPEIFLSIIEIIGNNFESGDLGPGTIVGSAAFNLFCITATCIIFIPKNEAKNIKAFKVFGLTSFFSIVAYLWLLIILLGFSPNVIDVWEATITFAFFPFLVIVAYMMDKDICWKKPAIVEKQIELGNICVDTSEEQEFFKNGIFDKNSLVKFVRDVKTYPGLSDEDIALLASAKIISNTPHSKNFYRINISRQISGSRRLQPCLSQKLKRIYDAVSENIDLPDLKFLPKPEKESHSIIEFESMLWSVPENVGKFDVLVVRSGRTDNTVSVRIQTIDGSATANFDYVPINKVITFYPNQTQYKLSVEIIDDSQWELDEQFFIKLFLLNEEDSENIQFGPVSIMEVVIIDNDEPGILMFKKRAYLIRESAGQISIPVLRYHGSDGAISVKWKTVDKSAIGGKDYLSEKGTITFKNREILFSFVPPVGILGGWLSFFVSLIFIGILTTIVGDLSSIFGCLIGLKDTITGDKLNLIDNLTASFIISAITFVAMGTSLPDLFASKVAACQEKYADNAIGNITGSNSVNVFLGLGLPWFIASVYHYANKSTFVVYADSLGFSVTVYSLCGFLALGLLIFRRFSPVFGKAELGGPSLSKFCSGFFLLSLWIVYIILSVLQAYNFISSF